MKYLTAVVFCVFLLQSSFAQKSSFHQAIFLGYPAYIFDFPTIAVYTAYNLRYASNARFSLEALCSFSHSKWNRDSGTWAHDGGTAQVFTALLGPRVYLFKETTRRGPYVNLLMGYGWLRDQEFRDGELRTDITNELGISLGVYVPLKEPWLLGIAYELYGSAVLKVGYGF